MNLTEHEKDRLLIFLAAELARKRRSNGLALNHPEAVALIADEMMEAARAGATYDEVEKLGYEVLTEDDVLPGVANMVDNIQVEPLFDDGTHIVILYHPILHRASAERHVGYPGELIFADGPVTAHSGETIDVEVVNTGDRTIQVTSHYHFFEVNKYLRFERELTWGYRPDIAVGTTVRFEPGETRTIRLRPISGRRIVKGQQAFTDGPLDSPHVRERALRKARAAGFLDGND